MITVSLSPQEPEERLVNSAEVRRLCGGIGVNTLYRWLNGELKRDGTRTAPLAGFPRPIKIVDRNYWRLDDVRRFIAEREKA